MIRTLRHQEFRTVYRLMQSVALWPYDYDQYLPKWLAGRYYISATLNMLYFLFWQFITLHILVFHVITVLNSLDNFQDLFLVLVNTLIYFVMLLISAYSRLYYRENLELIQIVCDKFRDRSAAGITYIDYSTIRQKIFKTLKIWNGIIIAGAIHWAVFPILMREKILPLQIWYPFDLRKSPLYELAYLGQVFGQIQVALVYGLAASLMMMNIFAVCGQFDILCCSLSNVYNTAMVYNGCYKSNLTQLQETYKATEPEKNLYYFDEELLEDIPNAPKIDLKQTGPLPTKHRYLTNLTNELVTALDDAIDHHSMLIEFCHKLEDCYHPFIMLKIGQIGALIICLLVFINTADNLSRLKLVNMFEYLWLTSTELFLICYVGQTLKTQTIKVGDALVRSPWYDCGMPFRRRALFIMTMSLKPIRITALKLFDLDFETYFAVLKASFSYYTILKEFKP